jgi:uncharacterized OB-fold protein
MNAAPPDLTIPDPRPTLVESDRGVVLRGWRCHSCAHPLALAAPWCPRCHGELVETVFSNRGTVWSSTMLAFAFQGRTPPIVLAYVDVDQGPRVLAHVTDRATRLNVGQRVAFVGASAAGDVLVSLIEEGSS